MRERGLRGDLIGDLGRGDDLGVGEDGAAGDDDAEGRHCVGVEVVFYAVMVVYVPIGVFFVVLVCSL